LTRQQKKPTIALVQGIREAKTWQRALTLALVLQFLLGLAMTASPWLHERLHHDAGNEHHECVVTVMHSGGTDGTMVPPILAPNFLPALEIIAISQDTTGEVASIFLRARVFEHAPPALV
jgi:hypothetical protein